MAAETPDARTPFTASRALLSAALGGLLCFGTACSSASTSPSHASTTGTDGSALDAAFHIDTGLAYCINAPDVRAITSSRVVAIPNSCMGMSYDTGTQNADGAYLQGPQLLRGV